MIAIPRATIKNVLAAASGLVVGQVVWEGEPDPAVWPVPGQHFGILYISTLAFNMNGWDDYRETMAVDGSLTTTNHGARELSLSLRYDSFAPVTQFLAMDLLERVRMRIGQPAQLRVLQAAACAIIDVGKIVKLPVPRTVDTRVLSSAVFDLGIRMAQNDDRTVAGDGAILQVSGTGTTTNDAGVVKTHPYITKLAT